MVKSPARAAEKARLCHGGDASRLADVCRLRILLPGPEAVQECLRSIAEDPGVRVVRVRNSMRPRHGATANAGFRVSWDILGGGRMTLKSVEQA